MEIYGITTIIRCIAVFTNERIIIVKAKMARNNWLWLFSGYANDLASMAESEDVLEKLKAMDIEQIIKSDYEKIIINKEELSSVKLSAWPVLFRSKIIFNQRGKKYIFKAVSGVFEKFKKYSFDYKGVSPVLKKNNFSKILIAILVSVSVIASLVSYSYLVLSVK
ncbi:MAG TPA: hypothetical protein VMD74_03035 [Candidatus Methylomirabilis sp.]|nr:hypothetical protein [Candidatus Methylomirabilis sp.]